MVLHYYRDNAFSAKWSIEDIEYRYNDLWELEELKQKCEQALNREYRVFFNDNFNLWYEIYQNVCKVIEFRLGAFANEDNAIDEELGIPEEREMIM